MFFSKFQGDSCFFRHSEPAKASSEACSKWLQTGICIKECPGRHPKLDQKKMAQNARFKTNNYKTNSLKTIGCKFEKTTARILKKNYFFKIFPHSKLKFKLFSYWLLKRRLPIHAREIPNNWRHCLRANRQFNSRIRPAQRSHGQWRQQARPEHQFFGD